MAPTRDAQRWKSTVCCNSEWKEEQFHQSVLSTKKKIAIFWSSIHQNWYKLIISSITLSILKKNCRINLILTIFIYVTYLHIKLSLKSSDTAGVLIYAAYYLYNITNKNTNVAQAFRIDWKIIVCSIQNMQLHLKFCIINLEILHLGAQNVHPHKFVVP